MKGDRGRRREREGRRQLLPTDLWTTREARELFMTDGFKTEEKLQRGSRSCSGL